MVAAQSDRRSVWRCACIAFAGLMGASFLYSDKFFIILESIGAFMLPFVIRSPQSAARMLRRAFPWVAPGIIAVLAVTFFIYSDHGSRSADATLASLGERIAGQGELWLMAVEHSPGWLHFDAHTARENLASLFARVPQDYAFEHHLGAEYFVYRYSPPAMYRSFEHNAGFVTPTMGYEAYGLMIFGFAGLLVVMVVTGVCVGWLMRWLNRVIQRGDLFGVLLPVVVMSETGKLLAQGTLYNVVSVSTFKIYAAFLALQVLVAALARGLSPGEHRVGGSSVGVLASQVSQHTGA
jgi:hypothetical protein